MHFHGREKLQFYGLSRKEAVKGYSTIDVERADCFKEADKSMILSEIISKHGSTEIFNKKLKKDILQLRGK